MSYRSIKRVLGESSLERKIRIMFGASLLVLFVGAFMAVQYVAEQLVLQNTRSKAHDTLTNLLVRNHFEGLTTHEERIKGLQDYVGELSENLGMRQTGHSVFVMTDARERSWIDYAVPKDRYEAMSAEERKQREWITDFDQAMLRRLDRQLKALQAEVEQNSPDQGANEEGDSSSSKQVASQDDAEQSLGSLESLSDDQINLLELKSTRRPLFAEYRPKGTGELHYYEVFALGEKCQVCHQRVLEDSKEVILDPEKVVTDPTFYVATKVIMEDDGAQAAINWIRAILMSVAIITVFFAMLASYAIVRYVIVKPLRHLTDISDEISRGKTELRADLQTGDEFEKLASSFNRMLRHLIDTQKALRSVNTDLDRKVDELAQLNMRLYEVNQLKGEFLANMSHELRTPLNSIIGFSEVLEGIDSLSDKQKRFAGNIRKSGRLLLEMINDILDLAKIDAGRMDIKPSHFKIGPVVEELVDMVRALATEKNIDMQVNCKIDDRGLYQDQVKIQQILTNLLSNAIKFTPEGGRITVEARRVISRDSSMVSLSPLRLELSVRDTGVGIAEGDRAIIFEKFRQGSGVLGQDSLTREYSGTGLGLSIVKELCRLLGGEVTVESEIGKGSVFTVSLPWECSDEPVRSTDLSSRLDELARSKRSTIEPRWRSPSADQQNAADSSSGSTAENSSAVAATRHESQ